MSKLNQQGKPFNFQAMAEEKMNGGHFEDAIALLTHAINHQNSGCKYDLFKLRSSCYLSLNRPLEAIKDADEAIHLDFRKTDAKLIKAKSLMTLKRYKEAESLFNVIMNSGHKRVKCREFIRQMAEESLRNLGFDDETAQEFSADYASIQAAIEAAVKYSVDENRTSTSKSKCDRSYGMRVVTNSRSKPSQQPKTQTHQRAKNSGPVNQSEARVLPVTRDTSVLTSGKEVAIPALKKKSTASSKAETNAATPTDLEPFEFDEAESIHTEPGAQLEALSLRSCHMPVEKAGFERVKPLNICRFTAIFVSNLLDQVTEDQLRTLFNQFGNVGTIVMHKRCAHINFENAESPRDAIFKYHLTPVVGFTRRNDVIYIGFRPQGREEQQRTGRWPEKECYYWRTTGCDQRIRICSKNHHPMSRGIDHRPAFHNEIYF
ncbi:hypothetical protein HDE_12783 [Halotydeus destructor]|nr:hypothetical protein HDE_12783 [Halotydeus destructor]